MAKTSAVWGIDIGNSSLKALRCRPAEEPGKLEALAFDFIEHSKILSQPGAEPGEILAETLQTFLSRNSTRGDQVAISVSGQNTISRFLKLPPVDPKKIPDIIKYEAKQWLPFDLDDVIWDFQPVGLANQSDTAVPIDSEVGMFAMKRDVATRTLTPYLEHGIDVDCIQSSPLSIYNFAVFDQLGAMNIEDYNPDDPPESLVILSVGTDATDVVITNGYSIWLRNIPIGGNSFTRALAKGLKLTSSKAEYLKRNAAAAQDPKAVFQAMRPMFNDMLSEVHRSLEYYQSLNRKARFKKILALGNAMKMPGLRQFLTQNLGYEVVRLTQFNNIVGPEVVDAALFKDNLFSFGVSYGLVLQQLGEASLSTNLIPKEIITDRIIREKKPWALAAVSLLMLGMVFQFSGATRALDTIASGAYGQAEGQAKQVISTSQKLKSDTSAAVSGFKDVDKIGRNLTSNVEGRITWLELLKAVNAALPVETEQISDKSAQEIERQNRVFISNIEAITVESLEEWFAPMKENDKYYPDDEEVLEGMAKGLGGESSGSSDTSSGGAETASASPTAPSSQAGRVSISERISERLKYVEGPKDDSIPEGSKARVVQLVGYHYHNAGAETVLGSGYLRQTLLRNLKFNSVTLPSTLQKQMENNDQEVREVVSMSELGISYPTLLHIPKIAQAEIINPRVILQIFIEERLKMLEREKTSSGGGFGGGGFGGGGFGGGGFGGGGRPSAIQSMGNSLVSGGFDRSSSSMDDDFLKEIADKIGDTDRIRLQRFDFVIQFAWVETPPSLREKRREEARLAALAAAQEGASERTSLDVGEIEVEVVEEPEVEPEVEPEPVVVPETPPTPEEGNE